MHSTQIEFLLTPDGSSARKAKRRLADESPGLYKTAGTWPELMAHAAAAYLLPPLENSWADSIAQAASRQREAFWASSLEVAPRETTAELAAALRRLVGAMGPALDWQHVLNTIPADTRLHRRLKDLRQLMEGIQSLPGPIQVMADLLDVNLPPLRPIRVYRDEGAMDLNPWQLAVLKKLDGDAAARDPGLQAMLEASLTPPETSNPALVALRNLFTGPADPPETPAGVRVIAVRDSLAEAEIAAGLIQRALSEGISPADIGLLLPDDPLSLAAVENVFENCGLLLSGFRRPVAQRDLGRETLRAFLLCLRKPAPVMAIAALLTSPLMPWPPEQGRHMAQRVMSEDVLLAKTQIPPAARRVMGLLDEGVETPAELQRRLKQFGALLSDHETYCDHLQRASDAAGRLQAALSAGTEIDWENLLYLVAPESLSAVEPASYWQEAVAVFHEGALPWCDVSHLFVLGFNDGHYPAGAGASAVFSEAEWDAVAASGLPVVTNALVRNRRRAVFAGQLGAAGDSVTLLLSLRDYGGRPLEPSSSLIFLARSLGVEPEDLVLQLERAEDARKVPDLARAKKAPPSPPRELVVADVDLGVDLLEAFARNEDDLVRLSPSAAETLMVSPFAWLLKRLGCEPAEWVTDEFDVAKAGTLAHRVFEEIFVAGRPLPADAEIDARLPKVLRERVLRIAPFLRSPDWRVERLKFEAEMLRAARHWRKLLASCNASVAAAEQWLRGRHGEVPLHGQADLLVKLPGGRLLVVDYKKSSSTKRRERMRSGFDLQAHLYRLMIQTGGLPGLESPPGDIGIVYYLLNDTTALADSPVETDGSTPGWEVLDTDISSQAMGHLDRRLNQIRRGRVRLNTADDEDWWSKTAGLPLYALDDSPLPRLFMHPAEEEK